GFEVTGFDLDSNMIEFCKPELSDRVFVADMINFVDKLSSKYDIAFNPFNSITHLETDDAINSHLNQVAVALNPGGLYLVGISLSDYKNDVPEEDIWTGNRNECKVTQVVNYLPPEPKLRMETVISHIVVENPDDNIDETYKLRSYDDEQWSELIDKSPFEIIASYDSLGIPADDRKLIYQIELLKSL
ncbi:class I SAM-dependent methyltransferase, partial [bacterium]|nr:class I SAM-dependent methyltransferase [bacterium]